MKKETEEKMKGHKKKGIAMPDSLPQSELFATVRAFLFDQDADYVAARLALDSLEEQLEAVQHDEQVEKNQQLREGLREALDIIVWMSGADDFAPNGQASEGWKKTRDRLDRLFMLAEGRE